VFIANKYFRWYVSLVLTPDSGKNTEKHHKIPRSLGGSNRKDNLVRLSFRKHFLAHWLLTKCTEGVDQKRMLKAFGFMLSPPKSGMRIMASWQYALARKASREGKIGQSSHFKGKKQSEETRKKLSAALKGRVSPRLGVKLSDETREKLRVSHLGQVPSAKQRLIAGERFRGNKYRVGLKHSPEAQERIRLSAIGNRSKTGIKDSEETLQRKRDAQKRNLFRPLSNNQFGLKGVIKIPSGYRARLKSNRQRLDLGVFDCPAAAHFAYLVAKLTA
jgi:hypothetical protein